MNDKELKEIYENRADIDEAERIICENCCESVVFYLKDNYHSFSLGLLNVLEMLEFAVLHGDLPKLPSTWCSDVENYYNITFDENISYYDEALTKKRLNAIVKELSKQ